MAKRKVPVILQLEMVECGAASLAMVMAYHEKWVPLEQLRLDCGVSRDGSTATGILKVARMYGFNAQGYRVEPDKIAGAIPIPCIIHWNLNHFVVLCGIDKEYATINDPARGTVKVPIEKFDKSFTGIAIAITKGENFEPSGKPVTVFPFIRERMKGTASVFIFILLLATLSSVFGIIINLFRRVLIDDMLSGAHPEWVTGFIVLFLAFQLLNILLRFIDVGTSLKISAKFAVISSGIFMWHALRLPMSFYSSRNAGDIATRQNENEGISGFFIKLFAPLFIDVVMVVFYLVIVLQYSILLTVIGLSSLVLNFVFNRYVTNKRVDKSRVVARDAGKLNAMTVSGIELIETIKSTGAEDGFFEKWSGLHAIISDTKISTSKMSHYLELLMLIISQVFNIAIMLTGAYLIMRGDMTVGIFFAFQGFLSALLAPFTNIIKARMEIQETKVLMERVQDVLNYETDVEYNDFDTDESFFKLSGNIEVKNITFGYNKLSPPLLDNFSMTLKPGGSVALIGSSGCGKSTIAKLISNLYSPWSGDILFDGKTFDDIPREIFTSSVSVVDQDIVLFQDTISNNITSWDKSIKDFEVILAARDAQIHSGIVDRDGGYDGDVLEGGKNFSGGERQRLEIAGALVKEPTIVILDEATSALDAKTEHDVINAIRNRDITTIIIAHRLSTIRDCDEIIVMERGKIVQRGTHESLVGLPGHYQNLIKTI